MMMRKAAAAAAASTSYRTDHNGKDRSVPEDENGDEESVSSSSSSENDDDDDSSSINSDDIDNDEGFWATACSLLFDRSAARQHAAAVLIAVVAAALGHAHLTGGSVGDLMREFARLGAGESGGAPTGAPTRATDAWGTPTPYGGGGGGVPHVLVPTGASDEHHHHHHAYKRTFGLGFCQSDLESADESVLSVSGKTAMVRRLLLLEDGFDSSSSSDKWKTLREEDDIDPNLEPFDFQIPALNLVSIMGLHYAADVWRDDSYLKSFDALSKSSANDDGVSLPTDRDDNYHCLLERAAYDDTSSSDATKRTVSGCSVAYIRPDISTFYPDGIPGKASTGLSVASTLKKEQSEIKAAHLSFTGFAAKFTNLGPNPLHLYWDGGRGGLDARLVGTVPPFESIGTATTPGQSFHITPTYDKDHVLQRWTLTADDALVVYDPYKNRDRTDVKNREAMEKELGSGDRKMRYQMQLLNTAYARDYLVKTGRVWLANFPRPVPFHRMWRANHFGQKIKVRTNEVHFASLPPRKMLKELRYHDYERRSDADSSGNKELPLADYRAKGREGLELTLEVVSCAPRVFKIEDFLSKTETEHIIGLAKDGSRNVTLEQSTVHPGGGGVTENKERDSNRQTDRSTRSSTNAWVEREASPIIDAIYRRAADALRIDESLLRHRAEHEHTDLTTHHSIAERMQLVHYGVGGEFTPHHDFMYPGSTNRYQPGRFATLLLYLNDVDDGGETVFPRAINAEYHDGIEIKPKAGTAVLFYNSLPDGNYDDLSQHQSKRVERGEKWMANLWVWDPIID